MITDLGGDLFHDKHQIGLGGAREYGVPVSFSYFRGSVVQKDYVKFANQRFLKTANWEVLGRLLANYASEIKDLDLSLLATKPVEGRKQISEFLLGPRENYPAALVHALHRIVRLDSVIGMQKGGASLRFWRKMPGEKLAPAEGAATLCGVFVETDDATGLARRVEPVRQGGRLSQAMPAV